jgi:hypothetical protein
VEEPKEMRRWGEKNQVDEYTQYLVRQTVETDQIGPDRSPVKSPKSWKGKRESPGLLSAHSRSAPQCSLALHYFHTSICICWCLKVNSDSKRMLAKLQNLVKRDPETYREEYIMQRSHFESEINILGDNYL